MKSENDIALKEWDIVVAALRDGRQTVLLRKGGIADEDGVFRLQEREFFLYPTRFHRSPDLLTPEAAREAAALPPTPGRVRLDTYAEVAGVSIVGSEAELESLLGRTVWSRAHLAQRWRYKPEKPLYRVLLRVHRLATPHEIPERSDYAGCVSWVPLGLTLPTGPLTPALSDSQFAAAIAAITPPAPGRLS